MTSNLPSRLARVAPELEQVLTPGAGVSFRFVEQEIRRETVWVSMRDGTRLATDLYLPPGHTSPAVAIRTCYGRSLAKLAGALMALARSGYVVISQDCRGTGDSEPESWDYYVHEREDSVDLVDWITRQDWFGGFAGSCGGSYLGATQWCMGMHPAMSAIAPEVCGLGVAAHNVRCHMFLNAYARSVGKGADKLPTSFDELERVLLDETLAGGFFNEPLHQPFSAAVLAAHPRLRSLPLAQGKRWLWEHYCALPPAGRAALIKQATGTRDITVVDVEALTSVFGHDIPHDAHMIPSVDRAQVLRSLRAPALMITGWYDWFLDDALATWQLLQQEASEPVRSRSRLLIAPSAHLVPGYHEGDSDHPELRQVYRTQNLAPLLLRWYAAVREGSLDSWPVVTYYLMGANEWHSAPAWPPSQARDWTLYPGPEGSLSARQPTQSSDPDRYVYDPADPTPTVGGSIISAVYPAGSVDVSGVQKRADVLTYTTEAFERDIDVVGPVKLILFASSSAPDTDFVARLSDVFPDGRAIQLQSGILRARYRDLKGEPELLEPGRVYPLEIDLWATANRFKAGHRLRLDLSSADFPRFERNSNRGGALGDPVPAHQAIHRDSRYPSRLVLTVLLTG